VSALVRIRCVAPPQTGSVRQVAGLADTTVVLLDGDREIDISHLVTSVAWKAAHPLEASACVRLVDAAVDLEAVARFVIGDRVSVDEALFVRVAAFLDDIAADRAALARQSEEAKKLRALIAEAVEP